MANESNKKAASAVTLPRMTTLALKGKQTQSARFLIEQGNLSNVKGIGGGTKKRQKKDIEVAKALWKEYKKRKRQET